MCSSHFVVVRQLLFSLVKTEPASNGCAPLYRPYAQPLAPIVYPSSIGPLDVRFCTCHLKRATDLAASYCQHLLLHCTAPNYENDSRCMCVCTACLDASVKLQHSQHLSPLPLSPPSPHLSTHVCRTPPCELFGQPYAVL